DAPQLFGNYLRENLFDAVTFREIYYLNGNAADLDQECARYTELLNRYPTDIVILAIGENTHIAFNEPHVDGINDHKSVKTVDLDDNNRNRQVDPNDRYSFTSLDLVPTHAITSTVSALFKATYPYASAPGKKQADAIYHTVNSTIG